MTEKSGSARAALIGLALAMSVSGAAPVGAAQANGMKAVGQVVSEQEDAVSSEVQASDVATFVSNLYIRVLERKPDSEGFNQWISRLSERSTDGAHVAYGFIFSEEYIQKGASDEQYVEMLYRAILGREADKDGKASWVRNLNWGATREGVFSGFIRSQEFDTMCYEAGFAPGTYRSGSIYDRNIFATGFVKRMYTECLKREPDKAGWESWIAALLNGSTGAALAKGFFGSAEFVAAKLSDGEYVNRLYRTILDRDPDEEGYNTWVNALKEGADRLTVLQGFVESKEFTNLCDRFGIVRGSISIRKPMLEPGIHSGTDIFYDQGGPIVVIDPGHQAKGMSAKEPNGPGSSVMKAKVSSGAEGCVTGVPEYKLNLAVSLKLRDELLSRGYSVVMVRETNNVSISNIERAQIANKYNTAVYIRVHANDVESSSVNGVLTICQTKKNPYIANLYKTNRRLSDIIVASVSAATGAKNTGVWETDEMTGTNWSNVPTTILEMGYMSNPAEDRRMQEESYQYKIARGAANGIDQFLGR